ncbi:Uncharacterised protein [Chlamydia trachomatis]|nr:Uncharacterised protein [Chlamydia trachomatis]
MRFIDLNRTKTNGVCAYVNANTVTKLLRSVLAIHVFYSDIDHVEMKLHSRLIQALALLVAGLPVIKCEVS